MSEVTQPRMSPARRLLTEENAAARSDWLGVGLIGLGLGLALVSLLGPLVLGLIDYRVTETLRNQTVGLDLLSLVLVVPFTIGVAVLALRGHRAAPLLALGPAPYVGYMMVQYVVGPADLQLPGNNESFFLLYLTLFVLAGAVGIRAWSTIDLARLPAIPPRHARRLGRVVLPLVALVVFARYVPALVDASSTHPKAGDYRAGPTFFWTIALLDLGVALPTLIAACVGLLRERAWALKALYAVVGWLALVGPAVAGMALTMYVNDDPNASPGIALLMTTLGLGLVVLAAFLYRPLFARSDWARAR
jgi:hypothetical protein